MIETSEHDWAVEQTKLHIGEVRHCMLLIVGNLVDRANVHDASKFSDDELPAFIEATPKLRGLTYGSPEYKAATKALGPALQHHYASNSHHPEHHVHGVSDMSLLDIMEMLADWKAATMRHADGDLRRSIEINADRFGISPQLRGILYKTAAEMGWIA